MTHSDGAASRPDRPRARLPGEPRRSPETAAPISARPRRPTPLEALERARAPSWAEAERAVAAERYDEIEVRLDGAAATYWCSMRPTSRPSFTPALLGDLSRMQRSIQALCAAADGPLPIRYFVVGSRSPGAFNLGGDLDLFARKIRLREREPLRDYAYACVDVVYRNAIGYGFPIVTIALVQGDALGGGFEAALSCDVIVAERGAQFGLPEVLFNLFPGMGAFSFLSRRVGALKAQAMLLSGRLYTAEELYDIGLVQVLAEPGEGEAAVREFIQRSQRRHNAQSAVYQVGRMVNPVSLAELRAVADRWVEAALALDEADLRKMTRLVRAQDRRTTSLGAVAAE